MEHEAVGILFMKQPSIFLERLRKIKVSVNMAGLRAEILAR
jgi:hypothetical protein